MVVLINFIGEALLRRLIHDDGAASETWLRFQTSERYAVYQLNSQVYDLVLSDH